MRKTTIVLLVLLFVIYTLIIYFCPVVSQWDESIIIFIQNKLKDFPVWIPLLLDSKLYATMIILPLLVGGMCFFRKYLLIDILLLSVSPLIAYILNSIIKIIVQRPRPPFELQLAIHPHSFSYLSNHTFITTCLWGTVIYYVNKYCQNKLLKMLLISFSFLWIIFVGLSRIWLGVHNPTDVFGAYLFGMIFVIFYIGLIRLIGGRA